MQRTKISRTNRTRASYKTLLPKNTPNRRARGAQLKLVLPILGEFLKGKAECPATA